MSSSAPDVAESSRRAGKEPEQEAKSSEPQRKWVALVSAAVLLANDDDPLAQAMGSGSVLLDLKDPPVPTYLELHPRFAPNPRRNDGPLSAYILAADRSGCILFQVVEDNLPDFFLCNTHTRTVSMLPSPQSSSMRPQPVLSIGLIADPHHRGHYVVAQLRLDRTASSYVKLLCYSTSNAEVGWFTRGLNLAPGRRMRNPLSETGVLAHDGRLWWFALAYGVFYCNPCTPLSEALQLRFVALPEVCEMRDYVVAMDPRIRTLIEQRRCVRLSEGKLRFVEIRGLSYDDDRIKLPAADPTVWMWTLNDPEGETPWTLEYEVAFAEIWDNKTYGDEGLLPDVVPHVALVDPNNHFVVYFFQGPKLFGFDMDKKKVVACTDCPIDRDQIRFRSSRPIVDAWEPPRLPSDDDDSSPDDKIWSTLYDEKMKDEVTESDDSWLDLTLG